MANKRRETLPGKLKLIPAGHNDRCQPSDGPAIHGFTHHRERRSTKSTKDTQRIRKFIHDANDNSTGREP
jgi:hypothetical protein